MMSDIAGGNLLRALQNTIVRSVYLSTKLARLALELVEAINRQSQGSTSRNDDCSRKVLTTIEIIKRPNSTLVAAKSRLGQCSAACYDEERNRAIV